MRPCDVDRRSFSSCPAGKTHSSDIGCAVGCLSPMQVIAMEAESEAVTMLVAGDGLEGKFAQVSSTCKGVQPLAHL
jgi:hypothetical protein